MATVRQLQDARFPEDIVAALTKDAAERLRQRLSGEDERRDAVYS
jgi:hypothetical protein